MEAAVTVSACLGLQGQWRRALRGPAGMPSNVSPCDAPPPVPVDKADIEPVEAAVVPYIGSGVNVTPIVHVQSSNQFI